MGDARIFGVDPGDRPLLEQWATVRAAAERADAGDYASVFSVDEIAAYAGEPGVDRRYFAAVEGQRVVGSLVVVLPLRDGQRTAFVGAHVDPARQGEGIGTLLVAYAADLARKAGYRQLASQSTVAADRSTRTDTALRAIGFGPSQILVQNELRLDRAPAPAAVDPAYDVLVADAMPPESWLDGLAALQARMSTDAPQGDLERVAEQWDAARYRDRVQTQLDAGRFILHAVARHRGSGDLAAFTSLTVSAATPDFAYQEDTLVLREHRGHGLGRAVKEAATGWLRRHRPEVRMVRTFNAETNAPMLAVNRALGYVAVARETEWVRPLLG